MNSLLLSEADLSRLHAIHDHQSPPPFPSSDQRAVLAALLPAMGVTANILTLGVHVGFHDQVSLVSPTDPTDDFRLRIVMPHEADPGSSLISVLAPLSLALIGRKRGELVTWAANGALREMRITSISKHPAEEPALL